MFNAFTKRKNSRKYYETEDIPNRPWRIHDLTKQTTAEERPNSFLLWLILKMEKNFQQM